MLMLLSKTTVFSEKKNKTWKSNIVFTSGLMEDNCFCVQSVVRTHVPWPLENPRVLVRALSEKGGRHPDGLHSTEHRSQGLTRTHKHSYNSLPRLFSCALQLV